MDHVEDKSAIVVAVAGCLRVAIVSLSSIFLLNIVVRRCLRYFEFRRKIDKLPGPPTQNPILGNIPCKVLSLLTGSSPKDAELFYTSQIQSVLGHTIIYRNKPLFRLWIGQEPVVCVWKPEIVELVLSDNFLLEKSYHYDFLRPWLGNGLLTSPGRIWRPRRKLLVPSFHFHILEAFIGVFDRKSKLLVRNIKRKLKQETAQGDSTIVDITPLITACTLDAICETIMGVSIDAQENPNNDYCQSIYVVGETFLERIIQPRYWLDTIFSFTELGKLYKYHLNKLHSFTRSVIAEKKSKPAHSSSRSGLKAGNTVNGSCVQVDSWLSNTAHQDQSSFSAPFSKLKKLDKTTVEAYELTNKNKPKLPKAFLDILLDKVGAMTGHKMTDEQIREEVDTFMFEGHDTTAMALSWTLFLLGHNLEAQQRLQQEIDHFFETELVGLDPEESGLDLDKIKKLKYLDCVIKEALRLCPSVPFIGRQTSSELKLDGYSVPAGSVVFVLIYQLHRNRDIYPNPEQFNPDRFLPANTVGRHPFAYVPFSAGPRNCIGQKFAMAEMKTILLQLLRNFSFESITPLDKAKVQMEMVLRPKCSLDVRIRPRYEQMCKC